MAADPFYTEDWTDYILTLRTRLGDVDFADLIFVRSEQFVRERRRLNPDFVPKFPDPLRREGGEDRPSQPRARSDVPLRAPYSASSDTPRSLDRAGPTSSRPACCSSSKRSPSSKTGSRSAESDLQQDVDLAQVLVKPEDTAGVPKGWGQKAEIVSGQWHPTQCIKSELDIPMRPRGI